VDLQHIATIKTETGLHEVNIAIDGHPYRYLLRSERDVEIFEAQYKAGRKCLGQALEHLKKNQILPEGPP
jgi:hypothetical protein